MANNTRDPKTQLRASLNPGKHADDSNPAFVGSIQLPDEVHPRDLKLWVHRDRNGHTMFVGRAPQHPLEQIGRMADKLPVVGDKDSASYTQATLGHFVVDPYDITLHINTSKNADHPTRPDWEGYYNPGPTQPLMRVAVWAKTDNEGRARLSGSLQALPPSQLLGRDSAKHTSVVVVEGQAYFKNDQQQELRSVDDPSVAIPFADLQAQDGTLLYGLALPRKRSAPDEGTPADGTLTRRKLKSRTKGRSM